MSKMFFGLEEAAEALGVSTGELEEMCALGELSQVTIGTKRRLVRVRDVEAVLERVRSGGRLRTRREFRAASVPGALERAAASLGIAPEEIEYEILERGSPQGLGAPAKEARIAVDLPDDAPGEGRPPGSGGPRANGEASTTGESIPCYAPEQVARLLGVSAHDVNLRIYRGELPAVNVNGYRWVPKEALEERLGGLPSPNLEDPPSPFLLLIAPKAEGEAGLGTHEIRSFPPVEDLLEGRLRELEEYVRTLEHKLRLEKARRAAEPA